MITFFMVLMVLLIFMAIKYMIDINALALRISKSKELNQAENQLEKKYQFIKGLF